MAYTLGEVKKAIEYLKYSLVILESTPYWMPKPLMLQTAMINPDSHYNDDNDFSLSDSGNYRIFYFKKGIPTLYCPPSDVDWIVPPK
jgi:hypothetical protein